MRKKGYAFALCAVAVASIALVASALGTPEWTVAVLQLNETEPSCTVDRKLGLFLIKDTEIDNCRFNPKDSHSVYNEDIVQFNHSAQYAVIAFCALAILSSLVAMAVSAYNICSNPYETPLTSVAILWYNVAGGVSTLIAIIIYTVLMYTQLTEPLLEDKPEGSDSSFYEDQGYSVKEKGYFGYSFFLLVVSIVPYLLGILLAVFSEKDVIAKLSKCCRRHNKDKEEEMKDKDVMMF